MEPGLIDEAAMRTVLEVVENFVIRRFVCGVPTHGLNKLFAPLYEQAKKEADFVAGVKRLLSASARAYPRDAEFRAHLASARLYGAGERREKTKLILERLEAATGHKELVPSAALTIEHVMPQTLTDTWRDELGPEWEDAHQQLLHTLGNLTLTSYNAELGNAAFAEKKGRYATSHVELNRYFGTVSTWTAESIEQRAQALIDLALAAWPFFGPESETVPVAQSDADDVSVVGTIPVSVRIRGEDRPVQSWVDVAVVTMEAIAALGEDEFGRVVDELPKFVNTDATAFRRSSRLRKLTNGAYLETNLSATSIYRQCLQAVEIAGLVAQDWSVSHRPAAADSDDEPEDRATTSILQELQHAFWTRARVALEQTGVFPPLGAPPRSHYFAIGLGRPGIRMALIAGSQRAQLIVKVSFRSEPAVRAFQALAPHREAIEAEVGTRFEWDASDDPQKRAVLLAHPFRLHDTADWDQGIE